MKRMISLSIDPSIHNVGWSTANSEAKMSKKAWRWGTFKLTGSSLEMKLIDLRDQINSEIGPFDFLVTEKPAFFSSERGQIAAHMNYTIDLAAVNYYIAGWFHMDHRHHFAITANQWKGSVEKKVTARRFFRAFKKIKPKAVEAIDEHGIDSVMLHKFWLENVASNLPKGIYPLDYKEIKTRFF